MSHIRHDHPDPADGGEGDVRRAVAFIMCSCGASHALGTSATHASITCDCGLVFSVGTKDEPRELKPNRPKRRRRKLGPVEARINGSPPSETH